MVSFPPRNEAEFVSELRYWFLKKWKDRAWFEKTVSSTGKPDLLFGMVDNNGSHREFHAEAKFVKHPPRSIQQIWNLLRNSQKATIPKMAAAGLKVYLIICVGGREADWYFMDPDMAYKAVKGEIPNYQALYLKYVLRRNDDGGWVIGDPADEKGQNKYRNWANGK